jgi:hypothetical protein
MASWQAALADGKVELREIEEQAERVAAMIVFWPLLILPAYAAFKQKQIIDATWEFLDQHIARGGQAGAVPSSWSAPSAAAPEAPTGEELVCPACGQPVQAEAKFCAHCGAKPALACPQCGEPAIRPGAKFCKNCGARLGEA